MEREQGPKCGGGAGPPMEGEQAPGGGGAGSHIGGVGGTCGGEAGPHVEGEQESLWKMREGST